MNIGRIRSVKIFSTNV